MVQQALTVSIVIPVYNEEGYIRACLDAIAAQTTPPLEVIIVDNNSLDRSVVIAKSYPFVKVVAETRQGIAHARNAGFNAARGDIIGRIDADTILPREWVEYVTSFYANPANKNLAITGGGYFYNVRLPRFNGWVQSQLAYRMNRFIVGHYIVWGSNMALPTALWQAVKSDICNRTDIHEDIDLGIHLHRRGYGIRYEAKRLRAGVYLKRVFSQRSELHAHMQRWPNTLRSHGYKLWWLGVVGNELLWYVFQPVLFINEGIARLFGRQKIV